MRLRNNPKALDILADHAPWVIVNPQQWKGHWAQVFDNSNPIHIEIGMGKGDFIYQLAVLNPSINYIGIEKYPSVLATAMQKVETKFLENVRYLSLDASLLQEVFAKGEVARIYLNFSDPWPKKRHAKRRLTAPTFLSIYQDIMDPTGCIEYKTDNRGLFEYSLLSFSAYPMHLEHINLDIHQSEEQEQNIMSEYERKFCEKGPIYKAIVRY